MSVPADRPIAIYHEHPDWFRPLFTALERRACRTRGSMRRTHRYDPSAPAAALRARVQPHEPVGVAARPRPRPSSTRSTTSPTSSARACASSTAPRVPDRDLEGAPAVAPGGARPALPARARHPRSHARRPAAAEGLRFPVVVKPNVGGSGAGIRRFESMRAPCAAPPRRARSTSGFDHVGPGAGVRPGRGARIVRVEVVGGRYLYAIRVYTDGSSFDLCPADICQGVDGAELDAQRLPRGRAEERPARRGLRRPRPTIVAEVERIVAAADIDVGGVEYLIDERDGRHYFYDINALSNFVADSPRVVGFDPFERLADYLVAEAERGRDARRRAQRPCRRRGARRAGGPDHALRILAPGVRRLAAQRARRGHGGELGLRAPARAPERGDRLRPHARRRAEPQRHQGRRRARARRVVDGGGAGGGDRAARDHGRGAAHVPPAGAAARSRWRTSTT